MVWIDLAACAGQSGHVPCPICLLQCPPCSEIRFPSFRPQVALRRKLGIFYFLTYRGRCWSINGLDRLGSLCRSCTMPNMSSPLSSLLRKIISEFSSTGTPETKTRKSRKPRKVRKNPKFPRFPRFRPGQNRGILIFLDDE